MASVQEKLFTGIASECNTPIYLAPIYQKMMKALFIYCLKWELFVMNGFL